MLIKIYSELTNSSDIGELILSEYGIKTQVIYYNGNPTIKVTNHISLNTIIKKIKNDFDFTVFYRRKNGEYLINLFI